MPFLPSRSFYHTQRINQFIEKADETVLKRDMFTSEADRFRKLYPNLTFTKGEAVEGFDNQFSYTIEKKPA